MKRKPVKPVFGIRKCEVGACMHSDKTWASEIYFANDRFLRIEMDCKSEQEANEKVLELCARCGWEVVE